jgi:sialic acid synthase SpsE
MTVTIVAEAGLNHGGLLTNALRLADVAKLAKADIVKFQTYDPDKLMRQNDPDFKLLSSLALTRDQFVVLAKHCESIGIEFMTTPGELDSLKFAVEELGVKRIKLGSDDLTNSRLQWAARQTGLPKIQSTGMATLPEILEAVSALGAEKLTLLHCVSSYPCLPAKANLRAMATMRRYLAERLPDEIPIGYSDHTRSHSVCQAAVVLGATMIEAHIMLMEGKPPVDECVSFTPMHFSTLVKGIRLAELMLGTGIKEPNDDELRLIPKVRKGPDGFRGIP